MWMVWAVAARAESSDAQVARGWYLWETGQDEAAAKVAAEAAAADPANLAVVDLHTAVEVARGDGFSIESGAREDWAAKSDDPVRRVALAMAITYRHPTVSSSKDGGWCDEVAELVKPVIDGEAHYWATRVDRQRELRCTKQTGHADAELRRISKATDGRGFADGVLAQLNAGYIKPELPNQLEKVWTEEPYRLGDAAVLWRDGVAGPGKGAAKKIANKALDKALDGSDPVVVHAALVAFTRSGQDKDRDKASARLKSLDPSADSALVRSLDQLADPPIYAQIDGCSSGTDYVAGLDCIDELQVEPTGSVAAYAHYVRKALDDALGRKDDAYAEARACYQADPAHRFDARTFARLAQQQKRTEDYDLALTAIGTVLDGRTPPPEDLGKDQGAVLAKDLEIRVELLRGLGRSSEAVDAVQLVQKLAPTPSRGLLVGMVLAEAGQPDEAAMMLAYAMVVPIEDTARVTAARDVLTKAAAGWFPSAQAMIDAAGRDAKDPVHPLLGAKLVDPKLLPTPIPDAKTPGVRVVGTWANTRPDSVKVVERLGSVGTLYKDKGVTAVALGVDADDIAQPAVAGVELRHAGPGAMRALGAVSLPTVLVVDAKGKVVASFSPYDPGSLEIETALDALLPKN